MDVNHRNACSTIVFQALIRNVSISTYLEKKVKFYFYNINIL